MDIKRPIKKARPCRTLLIAALSLSVGLHLLVVFLLPWQTVTTPENKRLAPQKIVLNLNKPAPAGVLKDRQHQHQDIKAPAAEIQGSQHNKRSNSTSVQNVSSQQIPVLAKQKETPSIRQNSTIKLPGIKSQGTNNNFPVQIARDKTTGKITDQEWAFNPKVLEKLNTARRSARQYREHREAVDRLNRHLLASSGKMVSAKDSEGISYEKIGTPPALPIFALAGAEQACYRVVRQKDGSRTRVRIFCKDMEVRWDNYDELFVHESLQPGKSAFESGHKTFRDKFLDQLSADHPVRPQAPNSTSETAVIPPNAGISNPRKPDSK